MALSDHDRERLVRILKLLGSDQPGERDAAALAATRLVASTGMDWDDLLDPASAAPRVVVQRVRGWNEDEQEAAEARMRQLKDTTERQERQIRALRTRINTLNENERRRRMAEAERAEE